MKILVFMLMLVTLAGAQWFYVDCITLNINQWTPATSSWHQAGLPNIKPVVRMVNGQSQNCTTISWQYGSGGDVFSSNPQGMNLFKPNFAGEGAVYYILPGGGWIEAWTYPVTCDPPRYKIIITEITYEHCMYQGWRDWFCVGVNPASLGRIKAMMR